MRQLTARGILLAMATAVSISACGGSKTDPVVTPGAETESVATVTVENQSTEVMTIYAWRSGTRVRLGVVNPGQTGKFPLARTIFLGVTTLRVEADPVGRTRNSISEEFSVRPGDEITLRIPPT
jgi:hypothetical protein